MGHAGFIHAEGDPSGAPLTLGTIRTHDARGDCPWTADRGSEPLQKLPLARETARGGQLGHVGNLVPSAGLLLPPRSCFLAESRGSEGRGRVESKRGSREGEVGTSKRQSVSTI